LQSFYLYPMGFKQVSLRLPTGYTEEQLRQAIAKTLRIREFTCQIEQKSIDARQKPNVWWQLRVGVHSKELKGAEEPVQPEMEITVKKRNHPVVVTGSGPAGFFAALVLQKAGFKVTLIERGSEVAVRSRAVAGFEQNGLFDARNNYAFGEGGAGTFSDGKLTSRSKHISKEKKFILSNYIKAGAPEEIAYLAHPHLGTDNLRKIVKNLRRHFQELGGEVLFETMLENLVIINSRVTEVITSRGTLPVGALFIASGHSAYETYRMLIRRGVPFRTKNFALGSRMEHLQEIINRAQWGHISLPGLKAAEYRLTSQADGNHPVFSFCMCPGGIVVPAAAYPETNIVNGMSYYSRNGRFANAACVAGIHPDELAGKEISPLEALELVEAMERSFYQITGSYQAPACSIQDFLNRKINLINFDSSYPAGLTAAPLWELLPAQVATSMHAGLTDFIRTIKGFETGILLGLESKTSSPVQVLRQPNGRCEGFENLYIVGEGSGYAGGIISSGADGVKAAMSLAEG
jgi:uncharacterized protein